MDNIRNKTVMITGGASGIGYKYAEMLLRNGAKSIAIIDLPTSNGPSAITTLENEFGKSSAVFIPCDVTKAEDMKNAFKKAMDALKGLDILINNAGILNDKHWEETIDLNVKAVIRNSLLAIDYMGKHNNGKGGLIVNIGSVASLESSYLIPAYIASKHAILGFTQSISYLYSNTGVKALVLCPGVTSTPLVADICNKIFEFVEPGRVKDMMAIYPPQSVEHVALAMIDFIQKGKNGAVWVIESGQPPYAVDFPHYSKRSLPI